MFTYELPIYEEINKCTDLKKLRTDFFITSVSIFSNIKSRERSWSN
jgi:hypothetical protein